MLKLKRYIKPYALSALLCIALLFGQAMVELMLPNYMSKIVNVGLQQGGMDIMAPQVADEKSLELFKRFMPKEDGEFIEKSYIRLSELDAQKKGKILKEFPNAQEGAYILKESLTKEESLRTGSIFSKAAYSIYHIMTKDSMGSATAGEGKAGINNMEKLMPLLERAGDAEIEEAIKLSDSMQSSMLNSVATVFIKGIYGSMGVDLEKMQNAYILKSGGIMVLLTMVNVCFAVGVGYLASRIGAMVARDLRKDVFAKITDFSSQEFSKFSTASLITRTTNDIGQLQMMVTMGLRMMCFAPIMGIGGIVMALNKSVSLSWIIALSVIVLLGVIALLFSIAMPRFTKMQSLMDRLNLVTRENLNGMLVIRAFGTQKFEENRFDVANKELADNNLFVNRVVNILMPFMNFVMNISMLAIIWFGAKQISQSTMQVGDMMAFMQYAMEIIMSFLFVSMMFMNIPRAEVSAKRISEVLETKNMILDCPSPKSLGKKPKGDIEFHNVSFKYDMAALDTLSNISFTAKSGETTAFIGSTGSGKSTLVNLIPRFFDVTEGKITFDGIDIRELQQKELRENIGYVPQTGVLFSGDIRSNLTFGDKNASMETLNAAIDTAQARKLIDEKEDGIDTKISQGGTNVSGGQRQRLSIARALVKKPPVYIFDDSFSALDFKTDVALRKALLKYTERATVLIVAQRISTIMNADKIIVLNDGEIVGMGTHKELLKNCETYIEIAESQLSKEELAI